MKRLFYLLLPLSLLSCFDEEAEVEEVSENSQIEAKEEAPTEKGVIASFLHDRDEDVWIRSFPLYASAESKTVVDSLYYLRHMGIEHGFYFKGEHELELGPDGAILEPKHSYSNDDLLMPAHGDYFNFYIASHLMQALVYTDHIDDRFKVLSQTSTEGYWLDINDISEDFAPYLWHEFLGVVELDEIEIVAVDTLKMYSDTTFEKELAAIHNGQEMYYEILDRDSTYFKVARHVVTHWDYTEDYENYPWAYRPFEEEKIDSGWINLIENGVPQGKLDIHPYNKSNSVFGIGMMSEGSGEWGIYQSNKKDHYEADTMFYYHQPHGKKVGYQAVRGDHEFPYRDEVEEDPMIQPNIGRGYDENWGLVSWMYTRVYEIEDDYLRLYKGTFDSTHEVWVKKSELIYENKFFSFKQYYLHWLNGNSGWQSGYSWIGGYDYLYTEPTTKSDRLIELPATGAFFMTGKTKGDWAEVKFKEVTYMPGCGEHHEDAFYGRFHTWKGWVRMTDSDGHPNFDEIILGC